MCCRYDPALVQQRSTASELLCEKAGLDESHLPGMGAESRRMAAHNTVASRVQLTATWKTVPAMSNFTKDLKEYVQNLLENLG